MKKFPILAKIKSLSDSIASLPQLKTGTFTNAIIASSGVFGIGLTGHTIVGITVTSHPYYYTNLYTGANGAWNASLTSAADGSHPSSGNATGTYWYIE